jgi:type IV secretory pathway TrbL component
MTCELRAVMRAMVMAIGAVAAASAGTALAQQGQNNLPFSTIYRRPTVSPYIQMSQQGLNPMQGQSAYQTLVQPQLQQQQQQIMQLQQARQMTKMQNQVQQIQRDTSARQLDESIRPTGHRATFQNFSHFYPQQRQR